MQAQCNHVVHSGYQLRFKSKNGNTKNRAEYELRIPTNNAKAGKYTISAHVKYTADFNGNMMILRTTLAPSILVFLVRFISSTGLFRVGFSQF